MTNAWRRSFASIVCCLALALSGCGEGERSYQGWVEADLLFIAPDEAGRVEALSVREGDTVAKDAPLFAVDDQIQRADFDAAVASVAEARARLLRLENAQQRKEEVAVLLAQETRADAALTLSNAELDRQKALAVKGVAAQAQLDTANANANRDRAALEEIRRQIVVARLPSRPEDIAAAKQTLDAAQARQTAAEVRLQRRAVTSPAAGSIQKVYARVGETIAAGRPVLSLLPPVNVKLRFFVPQAVLPTIAQGGRVRVRCDGCGDAQGATIRFISRTAEYTPPVIYSREERDKLVFLVEAYPDAPERLRVGQPIDVTLEPKAAP